MYKFSVTSKIKVSVFNRTYAKGMIDVKNLTVTLEHVTDTPIDLNVLQNILNSATDLVNNRIVIQNDDPYLIHLLEPKTGATVHNMLNEIRGMGESYKLLGDTLPPDTINAFKLTVFNHVSYTATMEGIAEFISDVCDVPETTNIIVTDGLYSVQV